MNMAETPMVIARAAATMQTRSKGSNRRDFFMLLASKEGFLDPNNDAVNSLDDVVIEPFQDCLDHELFPFMMLTNMPLRAPTAV
jgi:hypothetical protein